MPADVGLILKRWERYRAVAENAWSLHQQIADLLCPRKSNIIRRDLTEGRKQTSEQFDSTGEHAGIILAASIHGTLTSPAQKWFSLVMRQAELREQKDIMDWLEECADRLYQAFNQSNLAQELSESYLDDVYFGTSSLLMEEKPAQRAGQGTFGGFRFRALALGEYAFDENADGIVDTLYRRFALSLSAAVRLWGTKLPPEMVTKAVTAPEERVEFIHAVYPRESRDYRKGNGANMPWASCYVCPRPQMLLAEGGFHEFPFMVSRWAKSPGEIWGRGPGHAAYSELRTLNRERELKLEAASKAIDPPLLQLHESVMGDTTLNPAGINVITEKGAIEALDTHARFDVSKLVEDDCRLLIRQIFYNDLLDLKDSPAMTATEVIARQERTQRLLGPTMGRMTSEKLKPLIERGFGLMWRAGALPPMPPALQQAVGADIDIEYEGPLARAQKASDLLAVQRANVWVEQQIAMGNTSALDLKDADEEGRLVFATVGVPSNIVRGKRQVQEIRAQRAQAQQRNANMERMLAVAEGAGKAAPMIKALPEQTREQMGKALAGAA